VSDASPRFALAAEGLPQQAVTVDPWLRAAPEEPVLGLNLACAWPFPNDLQAAYEQMADELTSLDPAAWVYPFAQTHVTLVTFLNFARFPHPTACQEQTARAVAARFAGEWEWRREPRGRGGIGPFELHFAGLRLSRAAAFVEWRNPAGEVGLIRQMAEAWAHADADLAALGPAAGFGVPNIIHSTVLRFRGPLADPPAFLAGFERLAGRIRLSSLPVRDLLITAETRPYMRAGQVLHRLSLEDQPRS
jgi:hypothetical protein